MLTFTYSLSFKAFNMDGLKGWQKEMPLASLNTKNDLSGWVTGCDKDIGGFSEAHLEITPEGTGKFHGNISLELPADPEIKQSGYAALRTKVSRQTYKKIKTYKICLYSKENRLYLEHLAGILPYFVT